MRISFDIDDTLVLHGLDLPGETGWAPGFVRTWAGGRLRSGTRGLIDELRRRGFEIWIYTSSGRGIMRVRLWLWLHGVHIDGVVNSGAHDRALAGRKFHRTPSKYPPAFGISLHVDDSDGVRIEGEINGFQVLVVRPDDQEWTVKVLLATEAD